MTNPQIEQSILQIEVTDDLQQLRTIRMGEQERISQAMFHTPIQSVMNELNQLHDALVIKVIDLAEIEMARLGHGAPPVPYAYMLYGSAGRSEQTLYSDQDSGMIYENPPGEYEAAQYRSYFQQLATLAVNYFIQLGYPPCEGSVIASNPQWCLSLTEWEFKINSWFKEPSWESVRYLLIVTDGRVVTGHKSLAERMKERFFCDVLEQPIIVQRMLENTLRHKVLVGVFGQLLREQYGDDAGSLDIKYGAYIPMVNAFRLLAVHSGIQESSTLKRIAALEKQSVLTNDEALDATEAFEFILALRLMTSFALEQGQLIGSGKLRAEQLTEELKAPLKKALKTGKRIQRKVLKLMNDRSGGRATL
ncbi:MAG: DUF294 nucleotidyltransferase-like domain-containing protein [Candidatus Cohnella colombiensis]|uniref:DUF294 nucleotidyltransferase-like domain-containing protein n=1 Tax=Candidatus Cohnella colombiensis TaxID=3121368 RepID=A0AA95EXS9_9BACL|nr:MAG: DUF294 nucleotidyltransferase-like domain-containing protein [Cohnella sp.]